MPKKKSFSIQSGQLDGVKLKISSIENNGLQESVEIGNLGTAAQPMSGWVLASLRGQFFYQFPDDLILAPSASVLIYSGRQGRGKPHTDVAPNYSYTWTDKQVWNNKGDVALLFDATGMEIDRFAYPHDRVMGSSAYRPQILLRKLEGFEIADAMPTRLPQITRKQAR